MGSHIHTGVGVGSAIRGGSSYKDTTEGYKNWTYDDAEAAYNAQGIDMDDFAWKRETDYLETSHSWVINDQLREAAIKSGDSEYPDLSYMKDKERKNVLALDKYMKELPEDIMLYRFVGKSMINGVLKGNDAAILNSADMKSLQWGSGMTDKISRALNRVVGTEIVEASYMSTSYDRDMNVFTGKPFLMRIKAPKGIKGLVTNNSLESEILINRGTSYVITGWSYDTKARHVVLDVQLTGSR